VGLQTRYMTPEQLEQMRGCVTGPEMDSKTVRVTCNDGDVLVGCIEFICDEERDVIFQLCSSNNPTKYQIGTSYAVRWDDIVDFRQFE
jgi:hypothetical protein